MNPSSTKSDAPDDDDVETPDEYSSMRHICKASFGRNRATQDARLWLGSSRSSLRFWKDVNSKARINIHIKF